MITRLLLLAAILAPNVTFARAPAELPTLEVRTRSVNDLLTAADYLASLVGQEEAAKQFRGFLAALATEKEGLEGLDLSRPFGAYAFVKPDVVDSPFVVFIPVANEARFLQMLKDRLDYVNDPKDGLYSWPIPRVKESVHFRFTEGYACVSLRRVALDSEPMLKPRAFFAKDDSCVASAILRIDHLPDEFKRMLLGQVELRLQDGRVQQAQRESPVEKQIRALLLDSLLASFRTVLDDGKDLSLRLRIEPSTDDIALETRLTAKPNSTLAKSMSDAGSVTSLPAAIAARERPTIAIAAKASVPMSYLVPYHEALDSLWLDLLTKTPEESRELVKRVGESILPTLKDGTLDVAIAFQNQGRPGLRAAIKVADSKPLLEILKSLTLFVPSSVATFAFDRETIHGFALHRIELKSLSNAEVKRLGSRVLWLATSKEHIAMSLEDEAQPLKKALEAKPIASPILAVSLGLSKLIAATETALPSDRIAVLVTQVFGEGPLADRDRIQLTITGGQAFDVRLAAKGKAIKLGVVIDQAKK